MWPQAANGPNGEGVAEPDARPTYPSLSAQFPTGMGDSRPLPSDTMDTGPRRVSTSDLWDPHTPDGESPTGPPPAYNGMYGHIRLSQPGLTTEARIENDGRVGITIGEDDSILSRVLLPSLRKQLAADQAVTLLPGLPSYIPPSLGGGAGDGTPPPPMNIVMHVVGSRGDVQPFLALGMFLKATYGHRIRLATHEVFRQFVTDHGLEFFRIGGDPAELMAFMVKNPRLVPGIEAIRHGDIRRRRKGMEEIVQGCWRSCYESGDDTGTPASAGNPGNRAGDGRPFVADAIIANPPSFAHIHCAEKLGIPLHLMFTMPWSPTQAFPHPLANIHATGHDLPMANLLSYALVELMTWQGLSDIINRLREKQLHLNPLSVVWGPALAARLRIPYTYCWSPALIPKPKDWRRHITVAGFYFLSLDSSYQPALDLVAFLEAGPPPVYIGFGSIVVDNPDAMTDLIFEAVKLSGQRALVSKGWGGFGGDDLPVPEGVFMLGNVPHDWLFQHVSCVVHHGGAGTTSAGIVLGKPTVIVPFFGDQPFWGAMVAKAGAGPEPIPAKELTAAKLAAAINTALEETAQRRAKELGKSIAHEKGTDIGAKSFHDQLDIDSMRCSLMPSRIATWEVKRSKIRLSAMSAALLFQQGKVDLQDLRLYRSKEYNTANTPLGPLSGASAALVGTVSSVMMGVADIPVDIFQRFCKIATEGIVEDARDVRSPAIGDGVAAVRSDSINPSASMENMATHFIATTHARTTTSTKGSNRAATSRRYRGKRPVSEDSKLENAADAMRGLSRIWHTSLRSPMDLSMALATGFHNAPKLYGDTKVRDVDHVRGLQSGLKVAGKEFGFGLYDGISGMVTQPLDGAKQGGFWGFLKGLGKGIGGLIFKPNAAVWALPGYIFQGIYQELQKPSGAGTQNYIIAARVAQGVDEVRRATEAEQREILARWDAIQPELNKQRRHWFQHSSKSSLKAATRLVTTVNAVT